MIAMLDFFRVLFFAKTILLTPEPITLLGDVEIRPTLPLTAITAGASIEIDVSSMMTKHQKEGIVEFRRRVTEAFPSGSINAKLFGKDNREVILSYDGGVAYTDKAVYLGLYAHDGVPTGVEFNRVKLTSRVQLNSVKVSWRNAKH